MLKTGFAPIATALIGIGVFALATQVRAGSNDKAKRELGWRPAYPSWRTGFAEAVRYYLARRSAA